MLLQISYKNGTEEYLDVLALEMSPSDKWIRFFPIIAESETYVKMVALKMGGARAIASKRWDDMRFIAGNDWDQIKTIYINNRIAYARPYDRGLGAEL